MFEICFYGALRMLEIFWDGWFGPSELQLISVPINILIFQKKRKKMCLISFYHS